MPTYRHRLPQLDDRTIFLADGGLETTLVYHERVDLPCFAAFTLLGDDDGRRRLRRYFERYVQIARAERVGIVLETPTWRASLDWGAKLGYDAAALADVNRLAVDELVALRERYPSTGTPIVISGNLGPRGDGYRPEARMTLEEAANYHFAQLTTFAASRADMAAAFTMNYVEEAAGVALAARAVGMPLAISFTVETDGRLPSGDTLADAIARVDRISRAYPLYYMINCAHPTHFAHVLRALGSLRERVRGVRANASTLSHAELDACTELDAGDPLELAQHYRALCASLPALAVVGGCCGADDRHVAAIAAALRPARAAA